MRHFIQCLFVLCLITACSATQQINTAQVIANNAADNAKVVADAEIDKVMKKEEEEIKRLERAVDSVRPDENAGGPYIPPEAEASKVPEEKEVLITGSIKRHIEDSPLRFKKASHKPTTTAATSNPEIEELEMAIMPMPMSAKSEGTDIQSGGNVGAEAPTITIVTRSFIYPKDNVVKAPMNVILFPHRPVSKAETESYKNICEIYLSYFPETEEVTERYKADATVQVLPIFWMLKKKTDGSCEQLVKNYDYTRAQIFIDTNHLAIDKIQIVCQLKKATIIMDISSVEKEEDLQLSFDMWKKKMCKVPDKNTRVYAYDLYSSAKEVLGALGSLIAFK